MTSTIGNVSVATRSETTCYLEEWRKGMKASASQAERAEVMERRLSAVLCVLLGLMVDGSFCNCIYKPKSKHAAPAHKVTLNVPCMCREYRGTVRAVHDPATDSRNWSKHFLQDTHQVSLPLLLVPSSHHHSPDFPPAPLSQMRTTLTS